MLSVPTRRRQKRETIPPSYVTSLETRLQDSLAVISDLRKELAGAYFNYPAPGSTSSPNSTPDHEKIKTTDRSGRLGINNVDGLAASMGLLRADLQNVPSPPNADDGSKLQIGEELLPGYKFIGSSGGAALVRIAGQLKAQAEGKVKPAHSDHAEYVDNDDAWQDSFTICKQTRYWTGDRLDVLDRPRTGVHPSYTFPPPPLLSQLINLYFEHSDMYLPILHRPTFERDVSLWLHLKDDAFAATVLLVCAIASRWSDDPRATGIPTGVRSAPGTDRLACGWQWFNQVPPQKVHVFGAVTLYGLQYLCLVARFFEGCTASERSWTLIGVGLRLALDVGAHRRQGPAAAPSVERELWKRAFWALIYMDRITSSIMGRTCIVDSFDIDADLLVECDDEYFEHPIHPFQQPPGVPARVAFFNALLRLNHILASCLKSLYSRTRIRDIFRLKEGWEAGVVAELDSALHSWLAQVPEHLRWDPARVDPVFFDQSVALHCAYYYVKMLIHRAPAVPAQPSICIDAARACANMVDIQRRRKGKVPVVINAYIIFTSGLILLLKIINERRMGFASDAERGVVDVQKCIEMLWLCEHRWQAAGIYWDILAEVMSFTTSTKDSGMRGKVSPARMSNILRHPGIFGVAPLELSTFASDP
ncbi:fungal-specific transcription factor domain-containing protein [Mycena crocata]|nr:fungal-specific transcription factor domain-containing protein [Mycena crocata]